MKKGLSLLLGLLFALCAAAFPLTACGAKQQAYTLPKTLQITDETVGSAEGGQTTVRVTVDGGAMTVKTDGVDWWYEEAYDEDGNHTVHRYYEFNELRTESVYHYDKQGRVTSWESYDLYEGKNNGKCTYDEAGNLTEQVSYDESGALRWTYKYEYDEKGNRTRQTDYDGAGNLTAEWTFEYDGAGRLLKSYFRDPPAEAYCNVAYTYDEGGRILTETRYAAGGSVFRQESYTYDASGREVERVDGYSDGGVHERVVTVYEADGSRTVRTTDADGRETQTVYRYGQGERVTEKGEYDETGMLGWWYVYEYDENGLPAKRSGRMGAGEEILFRTEVTETQTVSLTEAQFEAFVSFFEQECGSYFS